MSILSVPSNQLTLSGIITNNLQNQYDSNRHRCIINNTADIACYIFDIVTAYLGNISPKNYANHLKYNGNSILFGFISNSDILNTVLHHCNNNLNLAPYKLKRFMELVLTTALYRIHCNEEYYHVFHALNAWNEEEKYICIQTWYIADTYMIEQNGSIGTPCAPRDFDFLHSLSHEELCYHLYNIL